MKKLLFILFIAVFLSSCEGEFDNITYTITNDSSKFVSFSFYDTETIDLDEGESATYTINSGKGMFKPENITFSGHPRSINLNTLNNGTDGINYSFSDNKPLILNVQNNLSIPVNLVAYKILFDESIISDYIENYINILDEDSNPITETDEEDTHPVTKTILLTLLPIGKNEYKQANIYTSTPNFVIAEIEANPSVIIDWILKDDTISVIIR
jgi:hypothetical protein